ncbi:MAG: amino acid ABC transporter substrate-binding protein [Fusobacteriaceae bacterium]|nr:amino acid ABC transporter substrate-binding protein [Fusobacteriaceae bacterium]MBP6323021.1 amino acid ABC transporter substrate-binding protein [Fusobacteriaceae bacterium]MBP9509550.1 amino acid ABC transporter substrate-binding protein [Fusobacteriaceae bacterium]
MKKFLLIVLGVIFMGVQLFAGDLSVERVQKKGELVVGLDDTFAPMGFRDEKGEIIGFDIDLAKEVGKRMGVKVKFLPCDWDGIILSLNSKKIDVVWNGMTITEKRKEQINFSKPYFTGEQVIITRGESEIKTPSDLKGKVVGLQMGSSSYFALEKNRIFKEIKEVKNYPENVSALLDLKAGRVDAVIVDSMVGNYYITKENEKSAKKIYKTLETPITVEPEYIGVGIRKSDIDLKERIDKEIKNMKEDGTYDVIYKKWFGGK